MSSMVDTILLRKIMIDAGLQLLLLYLKSPELAKTHYILFLKERKIRRLI